ncbi:MAG TPA: thiamine-phosphate kinase [Terriglobales bacterium]|nr:thiamine-phosphate kinase [Terriglobales bacterium]
MPLPERRLIDRIRRMAARPASARGRSAIVRGIGDDCAVLRLAAGADTLVTTDLCIEDVHFRRDWYPPEFIGRQCLTRGLSDIAAMGGEPVAAFLSLAVPAQLPQRWVDRFLRGLLALAGEHRAVLAGGDVSTSTRGVIADILVLGRVAAGKAILRSGARPGDSLYVTGALGVAEARIATLRSRHRTELVAPFPRLAVGRRLIGLASAMIDTSDGLSTDLKHICDESGCGAIVYAPALPAPAGLDFALHGGEDYELLFTAPPRARIPARLAGVPISRIGEITRAKKLVVADARGRLHPLKPQGWQHFSK